MKISAMLDRQKGRDFYDTMFLLSQTPPDFSFLYAKSGIPDLETLKQAAAATFQKVDLKRKMRDFDHLLFNKANSQKILRAPPAVRQKSEKQFGAVKRRDGREIENHKNQIYLHHP